MEYTIDFYSNWLIGSGMGGGSKDGIILKDDDGLPFIPGKTLKGLLRDAYKECGFSEENEIELFGHRKHKLDKNEKNPKNEQGKLYFSSAYLQKDLRSHLNNNKVLINGLFTSKTSTQLDNHKQAENHSLRKIEVCIPLELEASITPLFSEKEIYKDYQKHLEKAFKMLKLLGEKRYRGIGRCIVKLKNITNDNS